MAWLHLFADFGGGLCLANAIPHVVSGTMGRPFQSPFARPPGEGLSSPIVNVVWGFANLIVAYCLLCLIGALDLHDTSNAAALGAGMMLISIFSAQHFGRCNGSNRPSGSAEGLRRDRSD